MFAANYFFSRNYKNLYKSLVSHFQKEFCNVYENYVSNVCKEREIENHHIHQIGLLIIKKVLGKHAKVIAFHKPTEQVLHFLSLISLPFGYWPMRYLISSEFDKISLNTNGGLSGETSIKQSKFLISSFILLRVFIIALLDHDFLLNGKTLSYIDKSNFQVIASYFYYLYIRERNFYCNKIYNNTKHCDFKKIPVIDNTQIYEKSLESRLVDENFIIKNMKEKNWVDSANALEEVLENWLNQSKLFRDAQNLPKKEAKIKVYRRFVKKCAKMYPGYCMIIKNEILKLRKYIGLDIKRK